MKTRTFACAVATFCGGLFATPSFAINVENQTNDTFLVIFRAFGCFGVTEFLIPYKISYWIDVSHFLSTKVERKYNHDTEIYYAGVNGGGGLLTPYLDRVCNTQVAGPKQTVGFTFGSFLNIDLFTTKEVMIVKQGAPYEYPSDTELKNNPNMNKTTAAEFGPREAVYDRYRESNVSNSDNKTITNKWQKDRAQWQ